MDATGAELALPPHGRRLRDALIEALGPEGSDPTATAFVTQVLEHFRQDELPGWDTQALVTMFSDLWRAGHGEPGVTLGRAAHPDASGRPLDRLTVIGRDVPFLVDSVMGELSRQGLDVRAMFHPVVDMDHADGERRSMILVVLGAVGEDRRDTVLTGVEGALSDVRVAVEDFPKMAALMQAAIEELSTAPVKVEPESQAENLEFLRWLTADRFVFLGARIYRYPRTEDGDYKREQPTFDPAESLGVLRNPDFSVLRRASEPAVLAESPRDYLEHAAPVVVAKSNLRSRVHRRAYMDYIGVRRYGPDGAVEGEVRFVGLFTADAYEEPARTLPLVRRKVEYVLAGMGAGRSEHSERRLRHIVETYPRDELFQADESELLEAALGVLHLHDRPRVRLFTRKDPFDRFMSALLFVPAARYDSDMQARAGEILAKAWAGRVSAVYPSFADGPLARLHFIIGLDPGQHPEPDLLALETTLADAVRTWGDRFESALREGDPPEGGLAPFLHRWREAFPPGYRHHNDAAEALADLGVIETWNDGSPLRVRAFRRPGDEEAEFRFKLYVCAEPAPLSDVLPILENMGLRVLEESGHPLTPASGNDETGEPVWVHEYVLRDARGQALVFDDVDGPFGEAFVAVWTGLTESDGYNRLVLELGVSWRQAALIRALASWRRQSGLDPGRRVQEDSLRDNPGVARLILDLFGVKFDPAIRASIEQRREQADAIMVEIDEALQRVASLDADRVLRRLAGAVKAMTRTNYFQLDDAGQPKCHIAFKIDPQAVTDLPAPKPFREIFVSSPRVEGVHLRFGPVARGGLRWSDRRDDFRTEVLGLVKAQQVKNAVIVPVGAKGGFYPKALPREGGPPAVRAEAIEAYKVYLAGLLDLTDNLDADGTVVPPDGVIAHDGVDAYLVVAADKGTATFSDIANAVAVERGFWLGDAFASGGSAGYDHKAMGITARGAWEAVKRHFREMDKDIQTEPFTCVGVGDMSGDVFGNGMLLSKATKLVAAFDHRHIFIDPAPDPEKSWAERKRLFDLPGSTWEDYDSSLISWGGGVFPRSAKSVSLTPEIRALLQIEDEALPTTDLVRAILTAPVELFYLGGIGCYVKAPGESHADVGDKANDAVRVDAPDLRAQVVGEGANLGFTQAGRIAFARSGNGGTGGRINTDAIDNSAGVDTSDHEVNIKILLGMAERAGKLTREDRDALLASMTDDIAAHVLDHNYHQTLSLTLQQAAGVEELDAYARYMTDLVERGRLDRKVEGLPGPAALADMKLHGLALTRPELAVLTAYGKLELSAELVGGTAPDDPYFQGALEAYFPAALSEYAAERQAHPLRREIIATLLSNAIIDLTGPTFPYRLKAALGCDAATLAVAFEAARRIFRLDETWDQVSALDLQISADCQTLLYREVAAALRAQTYWLASRADPARPPTVGGLIDAYQACADELRATGDTGLSPFERDQVEARRATFVAAGAPAPVAKAVAGLAPLTAAVEIADLSRELGWPYAATAHLFHLTGAAFGFDRLKAAAASLRSADSYEQTAVRRLIAEFVQEQTDLTQGVAAAAKGPPKDVAGAQAAVVAWISGRKAQAERALRTVDEIEAAGEGWSFAKLTIANAALRDMARTAS
jgi:glutamate dehydrogenase